MYIICDLNGELIQRSNKEITLEELKLIVKRFSESFNIELITTTDESLYLKTLESDTFDVVVENNEIIDIIPRENPIDLGSIKEIKINQSKQELALYLQNNPLQFTDGKFYSVTAEKQTLLANALQVYQMKIQAGLPATLKWNATGEECTEWTLEDLSALAFAIADYVEPLVAKQQALEVQIKNAQTLEELEAIEINYEVI